MEASSNYIAWNDKMQVVLKENGLNEFIDRDIPKPIALDVKYLVEWRKCVEKARRIILEGVWDHIVLSLHDKDTPYLIWKQLTDLFQNKNEHRKLALLEKLRRIKMDKGEAISKYLTKFTHCRN